MNKLSDKLLIECYCGALKFNLEKNFIHLIEQELKKRSLTHLIGSCIKLKT